MRPEFGIHKIRITEVFLTLRYTEKLLGPKVLAGLDKNPEYTRSGVDRLYCSWVYSTNANQRMKISDNSKIAFIKPLHLNELILLIHFEDFVTAYIYYSFGN